MAWKTIPKHQHSLRELDPFTSVDLVSIWRSCSELPKYLTISTQGYLLMNRAPTNLIFYMTFRGLPSAPCTKSATFNPQDRLMSFGTRIYMNDAHSNCPRGSGGTECLRLAILTQPTLSPVPEGVVIQCISLQDLDPNVVAASGFLSWFPHARPFRIYTSRAVPRRGLQATLASASQRDVFPTRQQAGCQLIGSREARPRAWSVVQLLELHIPR